MLRLLYRCVVGFARTAAAGGGVVVLFRFLCYAYIDMLRCNASGDIIAAVGQCMQGRRRNRIGEERLKKILQLINNDIAMQCLWS